MDTILSKTANYDGGTITLEDAITYARSNEADSINHRKVTEVEFYNHIVEAVRKDLGYSDQYGFTSAEWQAGLDALGY